MIYPNVDSIDVLKSEPKMHPQEYMKNVKVKSVFLKI